MIETYFRDLEISTLRNDGSIDIHWYEDHYSGKSYYRYLNLEKNQIEELINKFKEES